MAGLVYAHDLSIADRLVLKNLENDITGHSKREDAPGPDSDTNASSTSSLVKDESSNTSRSRDTGSEKPSQPEMSGKLVSPF